MAPASPIAWPSHIPGGIGLEELTATICKKGAEGSKCLLNSLKVRDDKLQTNTTSLQQKGIFLPHVCSCVPLY